MMVESDPRLLKAFPAPPMVCLKRGPNLKDKLIRAKLPEKPGRPGLRQGDGPKAGFRCCKGGRSCSLCPFTGAAADRRTIVDKVTINHSGLVLQIKETITCKDTFCLYILSCTKMGCGRQYAGCTHRPLYQRFAEHLTSTRDPATTCTVGRHWQEPGHTLGHLEFLPVERLTTRCRTTLRERERDHIARTGLISAGLNIYS